MAKSTTAEAAPTESASRQVDITTLLEFQIRGNNRRIEKLEKAAEESGEHHGTVVARLAVLEAKQSWIQIAACVITIFNATALGLLIWILKSMP